MRIEGQKQTANTLAFIPEDQPGLREQGDFSQATCPLDHRHHTVSQDLTLNHVHLLRRGVVVDPRLYMTHYERLELCGVYTIVEQMCGIDD